MERSGTSWEDQGGPPSEGVPLKHQQQRRRRDKLRPASHESLARLATPGIEASSTLDGVADGSSGSAAGGNTLLLGSHDSSDKFEVVGAGWRWTLRSCLLVEPLLMATLLGVLTGIALGLLLKLVHPEQEVIALIGFPGELMLRLLKMLVLPLVAVSMVSGVCSLQQSGGQGVGRLARLTFLYYAVSTLVAIALGILLVQLIRPGRDQPFENLSTAECGQRHAEAAKSNAGAPPVSTLQALLGVGRQVVPDNVVAAAVDMNVLGIITFSLMLGAALASMGPAAEPVVRVVSVLNTAVGKMVTAALWVSPLGVGSLIAASILRACDLLGTLSALGLWAATVVLGLALFAFVVLPATLYLTTRMSPLRAVAPFAQSLLMAFGTSSSAASLPLAMKAATDMGCDEGTVSFFLPLGTAINMNGTALYEAVTAIFIAQAHGVALGPAELLVVAFTASLAAIGAPAIPSAGLVTMLIVLQAVSLGQYAEDLAVILAVDWLLDRIRTTVNLLSDAYGVLIVDRALRPPGGSKWREGSAGAIGGAGLGNGMDGYAYEATASTEEGLGGPGDVVAAERGLPLLHPQRGGERRLPGYVQLEERRDRGPRG